MDWVSWLLQTAEDPWVYLPLLFLYAILATVALPIPVEFGLLNPYLPPAPLILVMAVGKAVGGALVLPLGQRVGAAIAASVAGHPRFGQIYSWILEMTRRHGLLALFALLCIPFMTDSAPVYAYTILRSRGARPQSLQERDPPGSRGLRRWLSMGPFVGVNFAAALVRGTAFLIVPVGLGWP